MTVITLLQQYLPFTVLKLLPVAFVVVVAFLVLQQYLPFTVLKLHYLLSGLWLLKSVATVLTVYGIETLHTSWLEPIFFEGLQQYLPFTVLKLNKFFHLSFTICANVATVLTVYGIETLTRFASSSVKSVATVLTVYGIETRKIPHSILI